MKLNRLESTTPHPATESVEPARPAAGDQVCRVEALHGTSDRQRSLQQEMAELDPNAVGPFAGGERILQDAKAVATQLAALGADGQALLIKPLPGDLGLGRVDDEA
ncbi:MAG: hypothetical protein ACM3X0_12915 [Bacteroidota bacterium]